MREHSNASAFWTAAKFPVEIHKGLGTVVASIYSVWATSIIFAHTSIIFTNMSRHRSEVYVQQFDTFWNCVSYLSRVCVN